MTQRSVPSWSAMDAEASGAAPGAVTADELLQAAADLIAAGNDAGVRIRLLGGIAVYHLTSSSREPPLKRRYHDFDIVVPNRAGAAAGRVFDTLGYKADSYFNALHGAHRMIFRSDRGFVVDVLVGTFQMCHRLELGNDLPEAGLAIHPSDLLLTKLQIIEIEAKDLQDSAALLSDLKVSDQPASISPERFVRPLTSDWGFFHTVERNLPRVAEYGRTHLDRSRAEVVARSATALEQAMSEVPKSVKWKMRARIGEKVTWYELPEEV
jgi:hypothetical protein